MIPTYKTELKDLTRELVWGNGRVNLQVQHYKINFHSPAY